MHENLSPIEAKQGQGWDTSKEPRPDPWVMMGLAFGGVLTFVWLCFLLWAALRILEWAFG